MKADIDTAAILYSTNYDSKTELPEKYVFSPMRKILTEQIGTFHGNVLHLATSTGKSLSMYENQDCKVTGVDLSESALDVATLRASVYGIDFTSLIANVEALPLADSSFDLVVCQLGFCTFENPENVMREIIRVTKKGARVALLEHEMPTNFLAKRFILSIADKAKEKLGCDPTRQTLKMFRDAGFQFEFVESRLGGMIHAAILRTPE